MLTKRPVSTNSPLDLEVVKDRLNILHDDFDRDLDLLVRAAANAFETETGVAVMPADYEFSGRLLVGVVASPSSRSLSGERDLSRRRGRDPDRQHG